MSGTGLDRAVRIEEGIAYGVLTALGGYVCLGAFGYGLFTEDGLVGPGLMPAVAGGLVALIAAAKLVEVFVGRPTPHDRGLASVAASLAPELAPGEHGDRPDIFGRTTKQRLRQLRTVFVALTVTLLLVPLLGFLAAFFLLSVFISAVVERRRWLPSVVIAAASVAVIYGVFVAFLGVPLPVGLLGLGG